MANAGMRGRPVVRLVLSAQERSYLERQVRRHRVARSLSERCRVILRCADGLPSELASRSQQSTAKAKESLIIAALDAHFLLDFAAPRGDVVLSSSVA